MFNKLVYCVSFALFLVGCTTKFGPYEPVITEKCENKCITFLVQPICEEGYTGGDKVRGVEIGVPIPWSDWINDALNAELTNAGYSIANPSDYTVTHGPLKSVNNYMILEIRVSRSGAEIFSKSYQSKEPMSINLFQLLIPGRPVVKNTFQKALRSICGEFMNDLNNLFVYNIDPLKGNEVIYSN